MALRVFSMVVMGAAAANFEMPMLTPGLVKPQGLEDPILRNASDYSPALRGRGLQSCTNSPGTTCMCSTAGYPCWAPYGTGCACWSYSTAASCTNARGVFCVRPTSCVANCAVCLDTARCDTCTTGYMKVNGLCTLQPANANLTWVKVHNIYRCTTGAPPVTWNLAVASNAQAYVNTLTSMVHSDSYRLAPPAGPAGENLAMGYGTLQDAAAGWYNEYPQCGPMPGCSTGATGVVGHFTAMVWRGVSQIGCGINTARRIYICRYWSGNTLSSATANMGGFYTQNVFAVNKTVAQCIAELDGTTTLAPTTTRTSTVTATVTVTATTVTATSTVTATTVTATSTVTATTVTATSTTVTATTTATTVTTTVTATTVTTTVTATTVTTTATATTVTTTVTATTVTTTATTVTTTVIPTTVTSTATATSTATTVTATSTETSTSVTVTSTGTETTTAPFFVPVDGGTNRACRGANSTDKVPSYFILNDPCSSDPNVAVRFATCQALCLNNPQCVGIQWSLFSRCEVWIRPGGITATASVSGFSCFRRVSR